VTKVADAHGATIVAVPGQRAVDLMGALEDPVKIPVRLRRLHQDPVKIPVRLRRGNQDPVEVLGQSRPSRSTRASVKKHLMACVK
jgi:hypothetical protein